MSLMRINDLYIVREVPCDSKLSNVIRRTVLR